jgi:hypothetical protein
MKNALLTALTFLGLLAFAPRAEAGGWFRVSDRCDRYERPVYYRSRDCDRYSTPTYYRTYRTYRPSGYSYSRPTYVRDSRYSCYRGYSSSPRFSIHIGF